MPTELSIEIRPSELAQIVESVFGTMLNLEVSQSEARWFSREDRLTSAVQLAGDWNGSVLLECDRRQACRFAGRFLSMGELANMDPPGTVNDVVRHVLGELANMIGGNLKCVLPRGIRLSTPTVVDGGEDVDDSDHVDGGGTPDCASPVLERLVFQCTEGLFRITVLRTR